MKKKFLLLTVLVLALVCLLAISASAEMVYVDHNGKQVTADSDDIAYELEFVNPWNSTGDCSLRYIYLHDTTITKIVVPAVELTNNGTVYKFATYSYIRLSTGWSSTLSIYAMADKDTKENSLHTQITELEFHIPILGDGASSSGNLAGWTGLKKLSFYERAYEPQAKGGFLYNCPNLEEVHFYGQNNYLTGNFFVSSMKKVVFHKGSTSTIHGQAINNVNNTTVVTTVYLNGSVTNSNPDDTRLTWNKNTAGLKFVLLVPKTIGVYTDEQIANYELPFKGGNNAPGTNWYGTIMTYCEFYGEHNYAEDDHNCTTGQTCEDCAVAQVGKIHSVTIDWTYPNGYGATGTRVITCNNEKGCLAGVSGVDKEGTYQTPALVTAIGYSTRENGKGGLKAGYTVDKIAIDEYSAFKGKEITIGLLVADASKLSDKILDENGDLAVTGIQLKNVSLVYSKLDISLDGFTVAHAKELFLATMLYINIGDEVAYVQSAPNQNYFTKTVDGVTIEYVTFERVAKAKGFESITLSDGTLVIE